MRTALFALIFSFLIQCVTPAHADTYITELFLGSWKYTDGSVEYFEDGTFKQSHNTGKEYTGSWNIEGTTLILDYSVSYQHYNIYKILQISGTAYTIIETWGDKRSYCAEKIKQTKSSLSTPTSSNKKNQKRNLSVANFNTFLDKYHFTILPLTIIVTMYLIWLMINLIRKRKTDKINFINNIKLQKKNSISFLSQKEILEKEAQTESIYNIDTACVAFDNYIHIQWEKTKIIPYGCVVIYRRNDSFYQDRFSKVNNGDQVWERYNDIGIFKDKEGNKVVRGNTYCYTIHYKLERKNSWYCIGRFRVLFPTKSSEKGEIEKYEEKAKLELDKKMVAQSLEHEIELRKLYVGLDSAVKKEKAEKEYTEEQVRIRIEEFKQQNPKATKKLIKEVEEKERKRLKTMAENIRSQP